MKKIERKFAFRRNPVPLLSRPRPSSALRRGEFDVEKEKTLLFRRLQSSGTKHSDCFSFSALPVRVPGRPDRVDRGSGCNRSAGLAGDGLRTVG